MNFPLKKTMALLTVASMGMAYLVACGSSDNSVNSLEESSFELSSVQSSDVSQKEDSSEESSFVDSSDEVSAPEASDPAYVPSSKDDPIMQIPANFAYYDPIDAYFNDSVFIGYSIMMHFGRYTEDWRNSWDYRLMGTAEFRAGVGMNFRNNKSQDPSSLDTTLPKHNNVAYHFEDLPDAMGVKTMVIGCMPYSDMGLGSAENCARRGADIEIEGLKRIKFLNPDLHIIVLSGTYNTGESHSSTMKLDRVNNKNIRTFNNYILEYCNSAGIDFIDVSTPLTNGYGYFLKEWSSDESYHIKQDPYKIWIQILRDYARKKEAGTWQNLTVMPELGFEID